MLQRECSGCGHPLVESTDPANERAYRADVHTCFACETRDRQADIDRSAARDAKTALYGSRWTVSLADA